MITMEMLGRIRRMHIRDKVSLHEIAKRTGLSRNTVRSWLREPGEVQEPVYSRAPVFNKLSVFAAELERSLTADAQRAKQNRRTARALFTQIKLSGYAGGYTRVTDFIRAWRSDAGKGVTAFVPLRFDLGEAFQAVQGLAVFGRNRYLTAGDFLVVPINLCQQAIDHFSQLLSVEVCHDLGRRLPWAWNWVVMCRFEKVKNGRQQKCQAPASGNEGLFGLHACELDLPLPDAQLFLDETLEFLRAHSCGFDTH